MKLVVEKKTDDRIRLSELETLMRKTVRNFGKVHKNKLDEIQELSVAFVGAAESKKINNLYRGKNKPTDVLSFDYGEIIICVPVAKKQAAEHGLSLTNEIKLLFVHGLLHVLGFDHEKANDNKEMRQAEKKILGYDGLIGITIDI